MFSTNGSQLSPSNNPLTHIAWRSMWVTFYTPTQSTLTCPFASVRVRERRPFPALDQQRSPSEAVVAPTSLCTGKPLRGSCAFLAFGAMQTAEVCCTHRTGVHSVSAGASTMSSSFSLVSLHSPPPLPHAASPSSSRVRLGYKYPLLVPPSSAVVIAEAYTAECALPGLRLLSNGPASFSARCCVSREETLFVTLPPSLLFASYAIRRSAHAERGLALFPVGAPFFPLDVTDGVLVRFPQLR